MKVSISHLELVYYIQKQGREAFEGRQFAKRLKTLLPMRLESIKKEIQGRLPSGRARYRALVDKRFLGHIEELVEISSNAVEARMQYETHKMLVQARKSLRRVGPRRR